MNKKTDRLLKQIIDNSTYIDLKSNKEVEDNLQKIYERYNEIFGETIGNLEENKKTSKDYLDKALLCESDEDAVEYAKKALKLNPENIEAKALVLSFEDELIEKITEYNELIEKVKKRLKEEHIIINKNIGFLWEFEESQLYLRLKYDKMYTLKSLGRYKEVIKIGQELLRLDPEDRLGAKYILLEAYTFLEEIKKGEELFEKSDNNDTLLLFIMCILNYKKEIIINHFYY